MTREEATKITNTLAEIEAIERAIDALPNVPEFEELEQPVYNELYFVLKKAKVVVEKRLEEM